jgi:2-polyprenyl-6-hydroxyphenyl methylase/3-demethylubiquinone-9 3-methyltransferase
MNATTTEKQNLDQAEVAKFDALASRWWDRNSEFKPLHEINPLRIGFIESQMQLFGKHILDVGCGGGILSEGLARRGALVTGIDMAPSPLEVARLHLLESGLTVQYEQSTAEQFAQDHAGEYDIVTCLEMLEHVPDPASVVEACARLVKPGGHVFFSTLNRNPKSYAFAVLGAEYILGLLPKGTHDYRKFRKPSELCGHARNAGLSLQKLRRGQGQAGRDRCPQAAGRAGSAARGGRGGGEGRGRGGEAGGCQAG